MPFSIMKHTTHLSIKRDGCITIWCPYNWYKAPIRMPSIMLEKYVVAISYFMNQKTSSFNSWVSIVFSSPKNTREEVLLSKNFYSLKSLLWTHATQRDPAWVKRFQICFITATLFQSSTCFKPKPPSCLGRQTWSQATLTPPLPPSRPFHKNWLNFCSMALITFLGSIKMLV